MGAVKGEIAVKNKTYRNFLRALKMIEAKGYAGETALKLTHNCFENCAGDNFTKPVEWYIDKILSAEEYTNMYC